MRPRGSFSTTVTGAVSGTQRRFSGSRQTLERRLPDIGAAFIELIPLQPSVREDRDRREAEWRERAYRAERRRRLAEAQCKQLDEALEEADLWERLARLDRYLVRLEAEYVRRHGQADEKLDTWVGLVRAVARQRDPIAQRIEEIRNAQLYGEERPEWWPADAVSDRPPAAVGRERSPSAGL